MKTTQGNMLLSLRNVQGFLQSNASQLAAVIATGINTRLNAAITALTGHATHFHDFFSSLLTFAPCLTWAVVPAIASLHWNMRCRSSNYQAWTFHRRLAQGGSVLTLCQVLNFLAYGVLGRAGAPLYGALNVAAAIGDRLAPNELFCHNFACLARRV